MSLSFFFCFACQFFSAIIAPWRAPYNRSNAKRVLDDARVRHALRKNERCGARGLRVHAFTNSLLIHVSTRAYTNAHVCAHETAKEKERTGEGGDTGSLVKGDSARSGRETRSGSEGGGGVQGVRDGKKEKR